MAWQTVAHVDELSQHERKLCTVGGRRIALLRQAGGIVAIDNHCPHRGGPVGAGPIVDGKLTCPWHGLAFELESGQCDEPRSMCLVRLPLRVEGNEVQVDVEGEQASRDATIHRYLVRYGKPGHVGRFGSIERIDCQRGNFVTVATDRGVEVGEVLVNAADFDPSDQRPPTGELLALLTAPEDALANLQRDSDLLLRRAQQSLAAGDSQLLLLDAEFTFDRETLILYHPGEPTAVLGPIAARLAGELELQRVQFESLATETERPIAAAHAPTKNSTGDEDMRGPYERLKYDFRRVWECPVCHHRERTSGAVTSLFCACQAKEEAAKQVPMKLIDDGPRRTDGRVLPARKSTLP